MCVLLGRRIRISEIHHRSPSINGGLVSEGRFWFGGPKRLNLCGSTGLDMVNIEQG